MYTLVTCALWNLQAGQRVATKYCSIQKCLGNIEQEEPSITPSIWISVHYIPLTGYLASLIWSKSLTL